MIAAKRLSREFAINYFFMDPKRWRVAQIRDAEAVTSVINAAFRAAEAFLIDRDRINLESVQSLLQTGKFR